MATLLDLGFAEEFSLVFVWLLVFLVTYGMLQFKDVFKNKGVHAMLAFVFAVLVIFSAPSINVVTFIVPWFIIIVIFIFFIYMIGLFMGYTDANIIDALGGRTASVWWILVLGIIIIAAALSSAFGQGLADVQDASEEGIQDEVVKILTHPKILGFALLSIIAAFTIIFMTMSVKSS